MCKWIFGRRPLKLDILLVTRSINIIPKWWRSIASVRWRPSILADIAFAIESDKLQCIMYVSIFLSSSVNVLLFHVGSYIFYTRLHAHTALDLFMVPTKRRECGLFQLCVAPAIFLTRFILYSFFSSFSFSVPKKANHTKLCEAPSPPKLRIPYNLIKVNFWFTKMNLIGIRYFRAD